MAHVLVSQIVASIITLEVGARTIANTEQRDSRRAMYVDKEEADRGCEDGEREEMEAALLFTPE